MLPIIPPRGARCQSFSLQGVPRDEARGEQLKDGEIRSAEMMGIKTYLSFSKEIFLIFFLNMIKGGSERKKEVAGAESKHNFPGEVLAKGQRAPMGPAGCGNLRDVPAKGCGGMEGWKPPRVPIPSQSCRSLQVTTPGKGRRKTQFRTC